MPQQNKYDLTIPMLRSVALDKTDTCLTYALKRVELYMYGSQDKGSLYDAFDYVRCTADADKVFKFTDYEDYRRRDLEMPVGTLLVWEHNRREAIIPSSINADGVIVSSQKTIGVHFGVYEGKQLVSDATISSKEFFFNRSIRMRKLADCPPDSIIIPPYV